MYIFVKSGEREVECRKKNERPYNIYVRELF